MDKRDPNVMNDRITVQHYVRPRTHQTIGTFINWHNHPDTADSKFISSDFPHYLREFVEAELGGTAVYFSGTVGCQIGPNAPIPLWTKDRKPVYTGTSTAMRISTSRVRRLPTWPRRRSLPRSSSRARSASASASSGCPRASCVSYHGPKAGPTLIDAHTELLKF